MTSGMKIPAESADLPFCTVCVESKMTRQPHRNTHTPSDIPGYRIQVDVGGSSNAYVTWKGHRYFTLLVDDAIVGIPVIPCLMFSWLKFVTVEASSIILLPATPS